MASNEETFRVGPAQSSQVPNVPGMANHKGVGLYNHNPYPIEVTVRRVAEKVSRVTYVREMSGSLRDILGAAGYAYDDRIKLTVEPLD